MANNVRELLKQALESDDLAAVELLIGANPEVLNPVNGRPPVTVAKSLRMAQRLLSLGADVKLAERWWAPGFYTSKVEPNVAKLLVQHGAQLTVHAASGLGLIEDLEQMLNTQPSLIEAKGGDGCTPLHFARNIAIALLLLTRGARVDARDDDHDSTPAQWLIGDAPEVSRLLLERGAAPDIFMAAALGDRALAERLVTAEPGCLTLRIGKGTQFPPLGFKGRGGTIYQWTLAFNSYSHQVALLKGSPEVFDYLFENSDAKTQFLVSCLLARRREAESILSRNPGLVGSLPSEDLELVALYCWETNLNYDAVKLMLDLGFPIAHAETRHGYTPLHNAAWAGDADLVDLLLQRGHPVDIVDPRYQATPLGFAMHDCLVEKRHPDGEFARVIRRLIEAGSPWDPLSYPTGDAGVDEVFKAKLRLKPEGAALLGDEAAVFRLLGTNPGPEALSKALAGAAKGGHGSLCRRLLDSGAAVNAAINSDGNTPLDYALKSGSPEILTILTQHGA